MMVYLVTGSVLVGVAFEWLSLGGVVGEYGAVYGAVVVLYKLTYIVGNVVKLAISLDRLLEISFFMSLLTACNSCGWVRLLFNLERWEAGGYQVS